MLKKDADKLKKQQRMLASTQVDCKEPITKPMCLFEKVCAVIGILVILLLVF